MLHEDFSCCIGRNQETWTCGKLNTRNPCVLPHNRFSEPLQLPCCLTFHSWRKAELNNYLRIFSPALLPYELFLQLVVIYTLTITGKTQLSVIFYRTGQFVICTRSLYRLFYSTVKTAEAKGFEPSKRFIARRFSGPISHHSNNLHTYRRYENGKDCLCSIILPL